MTDPITFSTCTIAPETGIRRESPRPPHLRNDAYEGQFDWDTLFYDVYRVGQHVVFQGPPLFNLLPLLQQGAPFRGSFGWLLPRAVHVGRDRRGEVWLKEQGNRIAVDGPLGSFDVPVQPNLSHQFAGKRVLHSLSKNNAPRWIIDWIRFYASEHGADAVLLYDNASTDYTAADLQAELRAAFPALAITVIHWPFRYGPQGGLAGAVDGVETPWDSDYCQTGSLQHARLRFLLEAKSVLNVDIDEMVLSDRGRSIFAATEQSAAGFVKFPGAWICTAGPRQVSATDCRHGDFTCRDSRESEVCPPKWCLVPNLKDARRQSWSVHNLFGSPHNKVLSSEFEYRHMKGISNNWKYNRWEDAAFDPERFVEDTPLREAFVRAGLI
ncbi:MAG: glycosyltransferase family 2 protein [Sphingomonadales bacterium]|nr:glycosyltransferase family 2 protein [Sphingomonadales bacterium]